MISPPFLGFCATSSCAFNSASWMGFLLSRTVSKITRVAMSAGVAANGVRHEEKVEYEVPDNSTPHPRLPAIQMPSKAKQIGENEDTSINSSSSKSASASGGDSHATTSTATKNLPSAFDKASKGQEEAIRRQSLDYQKSTSLPPEILGLYKREDKRHSRNLSQQVIFFPVLF